MLDFKSNSFILVGHLLCVGSVFSRLNFAATFAWKCIVNIIIKSYSLPDSHYWTVRRVDRDCDFAVFLEMSRTGESVWKIISTNLSKYLPMYQLFHIFVFLFCLSVPQSHYLSFYESIDLFISISIYSIFKRKLNQKCFSTLTINVVACLLVVCSSGSASCMSHSDD